MDIWTILLILLILGAFGGIGFGLPAVWGGGGGVILIILLVVLVLRRRDGGGGI